MKNNKLALAIAMSLGLSFSSGAVMADGAYISKVSELQQVKEIKEQELKIKKLEASIRKAEVDEIKSRAEIGKISAGSKHESDVEEEEKTDTIIKCDDSFDLCIDGDKVEDALFLTRVYGMNSNLKANLFDKNLSMHRVSINGSVKGATVKNITQSSIILQKGDREVTLGITSKSLISQIIKANEESEAIPMLPGGPMPGDMFVGD